MLIKNKHWYRTVYLRSDHWLNLRADKLAVNPVCQHCEGKGPYDVHHLDYRNLTDCTAADLVTLCRKCHIAEHARIDAWASIRLSTDRQFPLDSEKAREFQKQMKERHELWMDDYRARRKLANVKSQASAIKRARKKERNRIAHMKSEKIRDAYYNGDGPLNEIIS